mmetsp:Transcript_12577/g.23691  ORF Transcript_12577/g.23691 Transcript_12577/m.23691 type:complete len:83 (-) Transcript_12577:1409-1657(-)
MTPFTPTSIHPQPFPLPPTRWQQLHRLGREKMKVEGKGTKKKGQQARANVRRKIRMTTLTSKCSFDNTVDLGIASHFVLLEN